MIWIAVLLSVAGLAAWFYVRADRARSAPAMAPGVRPPPPAPRYWGKRLCLGTPERACQAALAAQGHEYPMERAPILPLPGCTAQCACHFEPLAERRSGKERRVGNDRRDGVRFDLAREDRRVGKDRRRGDSYDWHYTA
jgi:hypothetical protein